MQRRHIFDVFFKHIKCVVKNVIIFDLIFDTNQKKSKSNFLCSVQSTSCANLVPRSSHSLGEFYRKTKRLGSRLSREFNLNPG